MSQRRILIIGAGYLGKPLAHTLSQVGHEVCVWVRTEESRSALEREGFSVYAADVSESTSWKAVSNSFEAVVYAPSTGGGDAADYERVYVQGMRNACAHFGEQTYIVFVSSTSVYPQVNGGWVTEASPTDNPTPKAAALLAAEELALERGGSVVRLSGIYGPGRSAMWKRLRERRPLSVFDAERWLNQIHREDAVSALAHVLSLPGGQIMNATDCQPVTRHELYSWLSRRMCVPELPLSSETEERKRGLTNKRVSNDKLLSTGWRPRYPGYQSGYENLIRTGNLDTTFI